MIDSFFFYFVCRDLDVFLHGVKGPLTGYRGPQWLKRCVVEDEFGVFTNGFMEDGLNVHRVGYVVSPHGVGICCTNVHSCH